ncbi:MAG: NTP transferase domain-containing protein [Candidatus Brocadiales bacterium]
MNEINSSGKREGVKVVILAAGMGSRLSGKNVIKPLVQICGLSLIQRAILSSMENGFREFVVVVGHKKEILIPYLEELSGKYGITVDIAENSEWEKGNGTSVFACRDYVKNPFYLLMCDHIFDPSILGELSRRSPPGNEVVLAVDSRVKEVFDFDDATKVRFKGEVLEGIGKTLDSFNGIDTGMFYCTPVIFDALGRAFERGRYTLSDGISVAIESGKVRVHDIVSKFWLDVDTEDSFQHAEKALLSGLFKPDEDGYVARYLNRSISKRMTAYLLLTPLTPNMISFVSFAMGILGAFLFSLGDFFYTFIAGLLVQTSSVVDGCDGEVARLKFQRTTFGGWFDTILDRYADAAVVVGITYGYWLGHPGVLPWLGGIMAMAGFILSSYVKKEYALRYCKGLSKGIDEKLIKRDLRLFVIFLGAMVNQAFWAMIVIGLASHMIIAWILASVYFGARRENQNG